MDDASTPTFERVLSEFELAPASKALDAAAVAVLVNLQRSARAHYAKVLDTLLCEEQPDELPLGTIRGAQVLHRRIADALAQVAIRQIPRPQLIEDQARIAEIALSSLRARADEIKWHAYERTTMKRTSWRQTYELVRAIESIGMERRALAGQATCTDAFAHCVLLASLNVGILNAPQMELAHRWLSASAHDLRVEPCFDPDAHWYELDLARENGPRRITSAAESTTTTRFFAVSSLGAKLAQARGKLYAGQIAVGIPPSRAVAMHFGTFLDLAERLWSPDWRRSSVRAEREKADGESIEVVLGYEAALGVLRGNDQAATSAPTQWSLRDRSRSGIGALVTMEDGARLPLGALLAFRSSPNEPWQLGCIARRIRAAEENLWQVGVRRLTSDPVALELAGSRKDAAGGEPVAVPAIYAPITNDAGRTDGLVIAAKTFGRVNDFLLPTKGGAFKIRINRVIDRGEHWVRVGFEVQGKQAAAASKAASK